VTEIGERAFTNCTGLTSVTIPNSVTKIGLGAFWGCTGLTSVTIPNSVTEIGVRAFEGCTGITSVTIPNSVTEIRSCTFKDCTGLTSVTIPNNVKKIESKYDNWDRDLSGFAGCIGLTSISIGSGITAIAYCNIKYRDGGSRAGIPFFEYDKLISIDMSPDNPQYSSADGVLFNKDKTILIRYPKGKQGAYAIPNSVKTIGTGAFRECTGLTSVTIPESVKKIEWGTFEDCTRLTSVHILDDWATAYDDNSFKGCSKLTKDKIKVGK
jgi:hypothetical protein